MPIADRKNVDDMIPLAINSSATTLKKHNSRFAQNGMHTREFFFRNRIIRVLWLKLPLFQNRDPGPREDPIGNRKGREREFAPKEHGRRN